MTPWIGRIGEADRRLLVALVVRRRRGLDAVMATATHLGDTVPVVAVAVGIAAIPGPLLGGAGGTAVFGLVVSHLMVQVLKRWIGRPRPHLPPGTERLAQVPDRFSFPSGHAAASLSVALPLGAALGGPPGALVLATGLTVGVSRVYLGVHYPGDVAAGWALAVLALALADPGLALLLPA